MDTKRIFTIAENAHIDFDALKAMISNSESYFETLTDDEIVVQFKETYAGEYASPAEFAEELLHETAYFDIEELIYYFDYQKYWDNALRHDFFEVDGYYFRSSKKH